MDSSLERLKMDSGLSYTYHSLAFPRYHYFRTRLQRLIPRLHNILDAGGLADCVSQGKIKLKEISSAAEDIADEVTVNLFAHTSVLKEQTFDLPKQNDTIGKVKVEDLQWTGHMKGLKNTSTFKSLVTVLVTQSMAQVHQVCRELTKDKDKEPREDIIVYNDLTKTAVLYTSLIQPSRHSKAMGIDIDKEAQEMKSADLDLVQLVRYVLERKVMAVFEIITGYVQEFIPHREEEVDSSLLDATHMSLIDSLKSPFVVKDLSPNNEVTLGEKVPTEADIQMMSPYIGRQWETVAPLLGISQLDIERIRMECYTIFDRSCQMLRRWIAREGKNATLDYLLKMLKEVKIDVSAIESTFSSLGSDEVKDEIFKKKLTEFVIKKTKCVVCDTLSKKYGISASLLNEFLNAGFFDYSAKILEVLGKMDMPKWPRDRTDDGVSTCRVFSYRCATNLTKVIHTTEDYIKVKLGILVVVKKLQFEVHGYLSQAKVPIITPVPDLPKLPLKLQYELLSVEDVTGCGTCYGELVLHVRKALSPARKEEIKQLLQEYKYLEGYKSVMMSENTEQANTLPIVELGQELRAQRTVGYNDYNFGSLGCFFNLRPNQLESNFSQQNTGAMVSSGYVITEAKDHCLTCAHCLKDCEDNVDARIDATQYSHLGTKKCFLYHPEALDVASVQVADDKLRECDSRLKNSHERHVPNWRVFDVDPIRRDVHKEGCRSRFTKGIVMSVDFMTEKIRDYNSIRYQETRSLDKKFDPSFNILIESLPGAGEHIEHVTTGESVEPFDVPPFSQEGDSGSVIIADNADSLDTVNAVALLLGAVDRDRRFQHSYASLMSKTLEEVQVQYDCIATPSRLFPAHRQLDTIADALW